MSTSTRLVRLRNGSTVSRAFLDVVMAELKMLKANSPHMLEILHQGCTKFNGAIACREADHFKEWFFAPQAAMQAANTPDTRSFHPSVRSVVEAALAAAGSDIEVADPVDPFAVA